MILAEYVIPYLAGRPCKTRRVSIGSARYGLKDM